MHGSVDKSIPTLRLPEFRRPPTYADITNIVRVCEKNKDRYIIQPWSLPNSEQLFSLRVFLMGSGTEYLRLKNEGKLIHPEWTLFTGPPDAEEVVWVYSTRDLDLVLGLIMAEIEGNARAATSVQPSSTLREMPSLRNRAIQKAEEFANNDSSSGSLKAFKTPSQPANSDPDTSGYITTGSHRPVPGPANIPLGTLRSASSSVPGQQPSSAMVLSGNLGEAELQNVIQSIAVCKMHGALVISKELEQAAIFFENGEVIDSTVQKGLPAGDASGDIRGDHAFLEILTWNSGNFYFDYSRKAFSTTITKKGHTLLSEGLMLREYCDALKKRGVDNETVFVQVNPQLPQHQVEAIIRQGLPLGLQWQVSIYSELRNGISLYEVLKRKPMPKSVWAPIVYNLLALRLIAPAVEAMTPHAEASQSTLQLDGDAATGFAREFLRPETGICNYSAFCFFVLKELERFKHTGRLFSVLVFQPRLRRGKTQDPVGQDALQECGRRLAAVMGPLDTLGHYQLTDLGLLLPESGELSNWPEIFTGCRKCLTTPLLPGVRNDEEFGLTISLYAPDRNGNLILKAKKNFPE
jgi:hypothetical protein